MKLSILFVSLLMLVLTSVSVGQNPQPSGKTPPDQTLQILHAVCPDDIKSSPSGCNRCPPITNVGTSLINERNGVSDLMTVIYGSFTRPSAEEAVASFNAGCEAHVNEWAHSVLLEKTTTGWSVISHYPGLRIEQPKLPVNVSDPGEPKYGCEKYALKDKRDILVCTGGRISHGFISSYLYTYDFAVPHAPHLVPPWSQFLAGAEDNAGACEPGIDTVSTGWIGDVEFQDLNNDGMLDITVDMYGATAKATEKDAFDCPKGKRPEPKAYTLQFLFDGQRFVPAPGNAKAMEFLEKPTPMPLKDSRPASK